MKDEVDREPASVEKEELTSRLDSAIRAILGRLEAAEWSPQQAVKSRFDREPEREKAAQWVLEWAVDGYVDNRTRRDAEGGR